MFIVGLTGGIATGKSTVAAIFKENKIPVVDADVIARKVVEPGRKAWYKIKKEFGESVFYEDGQLNREALGDIIFQDIEKRKLLNQITHPEIYKELYWNIIKHFFQGHQFIVMDLPLLFETGSMLRYLHKIIVVSCEKDLQLRRLMERNIMSESHAKQRIEAQMPLEKKCEQANFVVENSGPPVDTCNQVQKIITNLKNSYAHWKIRLIVLFCCICFMLIFLLCAYYVFKRYIQENVPH